MPGKNGRKPVGLKPENLDGRPGVWNQGLKTPARAD
jgi:hypothetical protein